MAGRANSMFETNAVDASIRKAERYSGLKHAIESSKYTCQVLPIQVGSRGYTDSTSFNPLQELFIIKIPNRQFHQALLNMICTTSRKSFNIWLSRNTIASICNSLITNNFYVTV